MNIRKLINLASDGESELCEDPRYSQSFYVPKLFLLMEHQVSVRVGNNLIFINHSI